MRNIQEKAAGHVQFINLRKSFGDYLAVTDVTLQIERGEFVAILGPSGCGKTTTLNMLAGFIAPSSGDLHVDGRSVVGVPPHKRRVGIVFQSYALFPHLDVYENIAFGLRMQQLPDNTIQKRVSNALEIVRLENRERRSIKELSGGQQQRVALARALVIEPEILLLDEPLSNLDASLREQMRFEIREIQRRIGITTVFVTHDQGEAMAAADRIVVMDQGRVRQFGTPREIYNTPSDAFVARFIGQANSLKVRVIGNAGSNLCVELGTGDRLQVAGKQLAEGDPALFVLRPEALGIHRTRPVGEQAFIGKVQRVSFLGSRYDIGVQVGSEPLVISLPGSQVPPEQGDEIFITWDDIGSFVFRDG